MGSIFVRIEQESDLYRQADLRAITFSSAFAPLIRMAIVFGFLAIVIVGGLMAIDGALNVGVYRENIAYGAFDATDEASVDAAKVGEAHDFIMQLADGYDTIAIAHRLSTVRNADHIFVLERGELIEQGRHDDLIAAAGLYGSLWRVQTGRAVEHA